MTAQRPGRALNPLPPNASLTRAASNRRVARVGMLRRGNVNAWRHGCFAEVAARPDVEVEVGLIYEAWPALDASRDRRLVELMALNAVRLRRAFLALEDEPASRVLTSHYARIVAVAERLEQQVREVARQRSAASAAAERASELDDYRPKGAAI